MSDDLDTRRERERSLLQPGTALNERFVAAVREARRRWPKVHLESERLARHVAGVSAGSAPDEAFGLDALELCDLYLACACALGVPAALAAFEREYLAGLRTFVRDIDSTPTRLDELRQLLRERLLVSSDGRPARISRYGGRGSLKAWVQVAAQRLALSSLRGRTPETLVADAALADQLGGPDAELGALRRRYADAFGRALRTALDGATARERLLLRLHLVEGMSLTRIAAAYAVSQSTVSRWLQSARDDIRDRLQRELEQTLRLNSQELASMARLVQSQLDISLATLLAAEPG